MNHPENKENTLSYKKSMDLCDKWDRMYKKYGPINMSKKMMKTPSYRAYINKWPFDFRYTIGDIDDIDTVSNSPSLEDEMNSKLDLETFENKLTDRQMDVWQGLKDGLNSSEIEQAYNFNTNGAVRWQKHQIKTALKNHKHKILHEYVCKSCAWIFKDSRELDCPKCGSRDLLDTTVEAF